MKNVQVSKRCSSGGTWLRCLGRNRREWGFFWGGGGVEIWFEVISDLADEVPEGCMEENEGGFGGEYRVLAACGREVEEEEKNRGVIPMITDKNIWKVFHLR